MALEGGFTKRPPDVITGPFDFKAQANNTGLTGKTFAFKAVIINPGTGEILADLWSTNVWIGSGGSRELSFYLAESRELSIDEGTYDLQVMYGDYHAPDTWMSLANKTVEVNLDGSSGGSGGTGSSRSASDDISIEITNKTTQTQYAWVAYRVQNNGDGEIEVDISFSPDPWGGGETFTLSPGSWQSANVEWEFDNTSEMNQQLCVELEDARYV